MNKDDIVHTMNNQWSTNEKLSYPGPQPISIERKHFETLKKNEYYIGHKNDGERIALYVTRVNGDPKCYRMNRKLELKSITLMLSKKLYEGTIIDGELVDDTFYIFDCPLFAGESIRTRTFQERLEYCKGFVAGYKYRTSDPFEIQVKEFASRCEYETLHKCDKSDGIVLVPNDKSVQYGTNYSYFKWKPRLKNTIDFAVHSNGEVFLQNSGLLCRVNKIRLDLSNIDRIDTDLEIYECEYVKENHWKCLHKRDDKSLPNSMYTYKRTLNNIKENISIQELISK